ncbi:MAG: hypothetical protein U0R72_19265 [Nakamurella multipartita]
MRAWATAVRVPTDHGDYWLKACGPDTAFEVPLYRVLAELVPGDVLRRWPPTRPAAGSCCPTAGGCSATSWPAPTSPGPWVRRWSSTGGCNGR